MNILWFWIVANDCMLLFCLLFSKANLSSVMSDKGVGPYRSLRPLDATVGYDRVTRMPSFHPQTEVLDRPHGATDPRIVAFFTTTPGALLCNDVRSNLV